MSDDSEITQDLLDLLTESLELVETTLGPTATTGALSEEPLPSLYEQCLKLVEDTNARAPEPVRLLLHFACTGGTVMSKTVAAAPNTRLLSEIDPFSQIPEPHFAPSDLILQLRHHVRPVSKDLLGDVFMAGLQVIYDNCLKLGERLVLRDHSHSHFCTGEIDPDRPTLRALIETRFPTLAVLTVRHPLDSYLSLQQSHWMHFDPASLTEYARRYHLFLDAYPDVPVIKYESFVDDPDSTMERLFDILQLPFHGDLLNLTQAIWMSGSSGRSGTRIAKRDRRPVPAEVMDEVEQSGPYQQLCSRLGYGTL